jgi:hypothetical protein
MKKILIYITFLAIGLSLQAQSNLYVQYLDGEQISFPLVDRPIIKFNAQTMFVTTTATNQTFPLSELANFSFRPSQTTSIAINLEDHGIRLFPNPVRDLLTLEIQKPEQGMNYRLFDLTGKLLKTGRVNSTETQIQMDSFREGTYVLSVDVSGRPVQSFKIVKQ